MIKSMRIGIDLNDVIRDYSGQFKRMYQKFIDSTFDIEDEDINTLNFDELYPFKNKEEYDKFKYIDYPYEIFARAEPVDKFMPFKLNNWLQVTLRDLEEDKIPDVMFFSPMEANLTIQASMAFLAKLPSRVREIYFPIDSSTIWDRCDIVITANPLLLNNVPDNRTVVKIEMPYNKDIECEYTFKSLLDLIMDEEDKIINLIENDGNATE